MMLDLRDPMDVRIRSSVRRVPGDRIRITIDYPQDQAYHNRVMTALSDIIRPVAPPAPEASDPR